MPWHTEVLNESQWGKKQRETTDDEKHLENKHFSYCIGERVYIQSGSQGEKGQLYKPEPVSREFRLAQESFHTTSCLPFPEWFSFVVYVYVCLCVVGRQAGRHGNETQFALGSVFGCGQFVAKLLTGRLQFLYIDRYTRHPCLGLFILSGFFTGEN